MVFPKTSVSCKLCPSRHISIFQELEPNSVEKLDRSKTVHFYKKGQIIFLEGHPAYGLYCISQGKVKIYCTTPDGKRHILRIADKGDPVGHLAVFSDQSYAATAEALEDTTICFIDRNLIFPALSNERDISWEIVRKLSRDLIFAHQETTRMAHHSVTERVAGLLLLLKEKYGKSLANEIWIDIQLSRDDLADLAGTSVETLVRTLTSFRDDGLIKTQKRQTIILDAARLSEIAGLTD
ncbi:MAG: Crp/Fnr family transcriptional regulator [Candidatus Marinimicrobia bacterium]|jgi:CRP/FNR family transcriptional regulator|nr:Crp/Fnr family transcriptional regulator [Candidatus Neomarinimicrobiota bacterium]MBT3936400.1 Crp/Fnr family transcriptional regulator [Candidatus Neomarinimicrobiota bacterium]MBT3960353.1 Crp/Fnr family transcriptional regulator [Candidatus Neomarinimicrobiota bacterium]MBT4383441.1 Crp/Fnr family transcriptional regulator [Candidatus Neomarinimicrobiota bacterium]MBT4635453.1 Crp/Fnr family transcriptional regulator [Candidatus Neomarinimicrobiota bacterium]